MSVVRFHPLLPILLPLTPMFVICPKSFDLIDAEWFDTVYEAKEEALDWSIEISGENVIVYEAIEEE